jgi:hypothetical protein
MQFNFTPEEAQSAAEAVAKYLQRKKMSVSVEVAGWPEARWRTTLVGKQANLLTLVEVQGTLNYTKPLKDFASWIAARRYYAELSLAIPSDATMQARVIAELQHDGVGLLVVDEDGVVSESIKPKIPALIITPDPTLRYGKCAKEVNNMVKKFNDLDRKDGLRDMCELVERETAVLAVLAVRKGLLKRGEAVVLGMDWSSQINILASRDASLLTPPPIFDDKLRDDMNSFRGARNLIDHKVRNKREERERQWQFAERMMQGPRLVAKLVSLQRKIR